MVGSSGAGLPADRLGAHPLRLVAVTHGAPSAANRGGRDPPRRRASRRNDPSSTSPSSFVDASNADVAAALAADAEPDAVIVPLVLSAGFHVRTGLSLGLDRFRGGRAARRMSSDPTIASSLCSRAPRRPRPGRRRRRAARRCGIERSACGAGVLRDRPPARTAARSAGHRRVHRRGHPAAPRRDRDDPRGASRLARGRRRRTCSRLARSTTRHPAPGGDLIADPLLVPDEPAPTRARRPRPRALRRRRRRLRAA